MMELLQNLGFNLPYIVAGFSGGIVTLIFVTMDRNKAALSVLGGALVANYLTAVVQHYLKFPAATELGCAFICGICAIKIVKGIYNRGKEFETNKQIDTDSTVNKGA